MTTNGYQRIRRLAQVLFNKKGTQIIAIDLCGISSVTDYVLLANGNVERHVNALAEEVEKHWKEEEGIRPIHVEGKGTGDWVVLDYFTLVVHLFIPSMRQKYQLDRLWSDGKIIDLELSLPKEKAVND